MALNKSTEVYLDRNTNDSNLVVCPSQDGTFHDTKQGVFVPFLVCLFLIFTNSLLLHYIVLARKKKTNLDEAHKANVLLDCS